MWFNECLILYHYLNLPHCIFPGFFSSGTQASPILIRSLRDGTILYGRSLWAPTQLCYFVILLEFTFTLFSRNVTAIISYNWQKPLNISSAVTYLISGFNFDLDSSALGYICDSNPILGVYKRKRWLYRQERGSPGEIKAYWKNLTSILLANVQSVDNKMDDLRSQIPTWLSKQKYYQLFSNKPLRQYMGLIWLVPVLCRSLRVVCSTLVL